MELLGHPARLRIVHALRGGRTLTTAQLCALMPDLSKATVYRHVELLAAGAILEVAGERRVRGAVERHFRLHEHHATVSPEAARSLSKQDHRRAFATAMATLIAEFGAYLDREATDPATDPVGYRQHAIWLSDEELLAMLAELRETIAPRLANPAEPDRRRYLLSPVLFPAEDPDIDRHGHV
ncbi:Helix-turn-helix domain-containing protein [Actinoplanes philippinensis]|uniref:Helix-turn-helix domain-containing protein n=2 Tax=Actinoplanes philippinensis TaxID=35752 RepID=A0A1I2DXW3_9ACTN|nr:Helix-turn-helix domain-containing protein [Actinoplanes philippinensis]